MAIELNELEKKELQQLMRNGLSKGEALVKMGKATLKVETIVEPKKVTKKPREVDPVKDWLLRFVAIPLEGCVGAKDMSHEVSCVLRDGTKKIDLTIDGESYTLALTKHKKKV